LDLKLFFHPVPEEVYADVTSVSSFFKSINIHGETLPNARDHDIALIGLEDDRGCDKTTKIKEAANEIRKKLYPLKKDQGRYQIVDLGNLKDGVDLDETYRRMKEVGEYLISNNTMPIFFGGSHDMTYGQYLSYEDLEKLVSLVNVDAMLDMEDQGSRHNRHIQNILLHSPNFLFQYSHLAYQSYLIETKAINVLEKLYFETYRVGQLRTSLAEMEPVIRNADMMSLDVKAIRSSDAPGSVDPQPFGLTGEEACQLCWYAGMNEKMSSLGIYEYDPGNDDLSMKTASVIATMIWYFVEGYENQKDHKDFKSNDYLQFVVSMPSEPESITFHKSKLSEKWWMEVPTTHEEDLFQRNCIVPCSYADYETANKGELPERYISAHAKLS